MRKPNLLFNRTWGIWLLRLWKKVVPTLSLSLVLDASAAPLRNFGFEDYDPTTRTLQDWHLATTLRPNSINETNISLGVPPGFVDGPLVYVVDVNLFPNLGLDGKYALRFAAPGPWTLSQSGSLSTDAKVLSWVNIGPVQMTLKLNGNTIPVDYYYDSLFPFVHAYAQADISAYAGKNVDLAMMFGTVPDRFNAPGQAFFSIIDNIGFEPIPEPSAVALFVVGLVLFWRWKFKCG